MRAHRRLTPPGRSKLLEGPVGIVVTVVALGFIPAMLVYKSCTALPGQTRDEFSEKYSCPHDSITSKERPDVHAEQFEVPRAPPADVAADPARLEVWKSNQPKPWDVEFFELTGCGHHVLWGCRLPSRSSSAGVHAFCPYTRDLP